jgi:hypothetical protein
MNGLRKQTTLIVLLLWVAVSSPFFAVLVASSHGDHQTSLAFNGNNIEVALHHSGESESHSHEEGHEHHTKDHNVLISLDDVRTPVHFLIAVPEPIMAYAIQSISSLWNHNEYLPNLIINSIITEKPPSTRAVLKATVLLL